MLGVVILGVMVLSGCAGVEPKSRTPGPEPRPLGRELQEEVPWAKSSSDKRSTLSPSATATGALTLQQALTLALAGNPELAGTSWDKKVGEARTLQASLPPNPELSVELEEFGGTGDLNGFDAAQSTVQLSQLIELGGKRTKRTRLAALENDLAGWDYEIKRIDALTEANKTFIDVLAAQEQVAVAEELVRLAARARETASERVLAGKVSPLEETKAGVALSETRIQLEKARSNFIATRKRLAAIWAETTPAFERVEGNLDSVLPIPSDETLKKYLERNPDLARWAKEMEQRTAIFDVEKAKRIPDLTVSGGVKQFADTNDAALVFGVSLPLPLFDRNQGGIQEAEYRQAKAREESRAARAKAASKLGDAYQALVFSYEESKSLKQDILPAAQGAFEAAEEGFREGKFSFLELLDAQRTLFESRGRYVESLSNYHKAVADVERLIATPLAEVTDGSHQ
jgi:cobalt-zinc-cadmium efflux system outer membrane protein